MNYKKLFSAFILLSLLSALLFCEHTKEDDIALAKKLHFPKEENASMNMYISWLKAFGNEFENYEIDETKVKKSLHSFFGNENYIIISKYNYKRYNNIKIYAAIKECPEVRHGATKGIFIDENGNQLLFFDMKRGVYTPKKTILDLAKLGFTDETPLCFVINRFVDPLKLQIIDKDKCVTVSYYYWERKQKPNKVSHYYIPTDIIRGTYDSKNKKIDFSVLIDGDYSDRYSERRKDLAVLKQYKAKGYRVYVPEKPLKEDVETAKKL